MLAITGKSIQTLLTAMMMAFWCSLAASTNPSMAPEQPLHTLERALENTRSRMVSGIRYESTFIQTVETDDGDSVETQVIHVDSRKPKPESMELVSVNGKPADEDKKAEFTKELRKQYDQQDEDSGEKQDGAKRISFDQLALDQASLVSRSDDAMTFVVPDGALSILPGSLEAMAENLTTHLVVDTRTVGQPIIRTIRVFSESSFKPGLIGKIRNLDLEMHLAVFDDDQLLVLDEFTMRINAKVLFKKVDATTRVRYSDYTIYPVGSVD